MTRLDSSNLRDFNAETSSHKTSRMAEVQNANPAIRADLPTRRKRRESIPEDIKKYEIFADLLPREQTLFAAYDPPESPASANSSEDYFEPIDEQEIYDLISTISDPEHPLSLGSLNVVQLSDIFIKPLTKTLTQVTVLITPTITHCSLATAIGLGVRVRLENSLPPDWRVDVQIKEGTHSTADQVTKQLADKERVAAALENAQLMAVLKKMMETCV